MHATPAPRLKARTAPTDASGMDSATTTLGRTPSDPSAPVGDAADAPAALTADQPVGTRDHDTRDHGTGVPADGTDDPAATTRPLSPVENLHLDRLRVWLREDGVDTADTASLAARWADLLARHGADAPAPTGAVAALGIAVGDVLVDRAPGATWVMCAGPDGATPGVVHPARPSAPVVAVLDAHARWRARAQDWVPGYVDRAVAHLTDPSTAVTSAAGPVPSPVPASPTPAPADAADPVPAADPAPAAAAQAAPATAPTALPSRRRARPDAGPATSPAADGALPGPDALPHRPSETVLDLALRSLERALARAVADPAGVGAFVSVRDASGLRTTDLDGPDALAQAREHARRSRADEAAVAWAEPHDGGSRVVVDASAAGEVGIRVAHAFAADADGGREVGGPLVLGQAAPLL
ncbi:hypothetical protein [Cellulomonas oligotrophica]|uniref:DUF3806 domain-containing protein n=1 Tax=Cellulomonas oligotrophica TaxID=931536 RepID=A0A7Y9FGU6_9CELL|nr:hypothetical protein [Cellulomonas oligotrophica]NYD87086.1 hypothetical protein [Cellulomonas oligotrophica]GIG32128.1 hypothetical protein Col01nite_12870 [Cellulomonas oligotrophica]